MDRRATPRKSLGDPKWGRDPEVEKPCIRGMDAAASYSYTVVIPIIDNNPALSLEWLAKHLVQAFYAKKGVNLKQIATKTISAVLTS